MYERFYDELFESGKFAIISEMSNSSYLIGPCKIIDDDRKQEFVVTMEGDQKITCTCGLFEHLGMICRHSLKVCASSLTSSGFIHLYETAMTLLLSVRN